MGSMSRAGGTEIRAKKPRRLRKCQTFIAASFENCSQHANSSTQHHNSHAYFKIVFLLKFDVNNNVKQEFPHFFGINGSARPAD
jgi:hypothetical protein